MSRVASENSISLLFDYAVSQPDGFRIDEVCAALGWRRDRVRDAIRGLRLSFAEDSINLVCEDLGDGGQWLYRLVGTHSEAKWWAYNRVADAETRIRTVHAVTASVVNASDGRTVEGRKARAMEVALRHLIENVELIEAEGDA